MLEEIRKRVKEFYTPIDGSPLEPAEKDIRSLIQIVDDLYTRIGMLERELRLCGIKVVRFAGLKEKITTYKGSNDVYHPDTVHDLINDVLNISTDAINKLNRDDGCKEALYELLNLISGWRLDHYGDHLSYTGTVTQSNYNRYRDVLERKIS